MALFSILFVVIGKKTVSFPFLRSFFYLRRLISRTPMKTKPLLLCFSLLFLQISCREKPSRLLSPEHQEALSGFEIMEGMEIGLFAAEPLIADPVAMEIDEKGDIYVVEMPGYPLDLSFSGRIKLLRDTDHDGFPDTSILFADSLRLPTGIQKWKQGFIVTDAPDVIYLEDTDNDGKADKREVLLTGFALSNPQHNLNTPRFEADNWIYLGHEENVTPFTYTREFGDEGREIIWPQLGNKKALEKNAGQKMVRFRPDKFRAEALSGFTQFGHTRDSWGHRIYTSNANHLFHEVIAAEYLSHNPALMLTQSMASVPDHGDACQVFPVTENPNHQLLTDVGVITSSCAVTWYLGGALGDRFKDVTFVAEPVHNLVHADVMENDGVTFKAKRLLEKKEFLASKDAWFRPVNFYIGPDGALYVIDYYRQLIEHPEWMSDEVNRSGALYNGKDKGRIYRITLKDAEKPEWIHRLSLDTQTPGELAGYLAHENIWYRRTAQRLLIHKKDPEAIKVIEELLKNKEKKEGRIHALWLLEEWDSLKEQHLREALNDPEPGIRENALKLLELHPYPALLPLAHPLTTAPEAKVSFQAINTLGRLNALQLTDEVTKKALADKWTGMALMAALPEKETDLLSAGMKLSDAHSSQDFFKMLASAIANRNHPQATEKAISILKDYPEKSTLQAAAVKGLVNVWKHHPPQYALPLSVKEFAWKKAMEATDHQGMAWVSLLKYTGLPAINSQIFAEMNSLVNDTTANAEKRAIRLTMLQLSGHPVKEKMLTELLARPGPEAIHAAVCNILISQRKENLILGHWSQLSPETKAMVTDHIGEQAPAALSLLRAIELERVPKSDISWPQIVNLMNFYDHEVRILARKVFSVNEDRKAVLQHYLPALSLKGYPGDGEKIFKKMCMACHRKGNLGNQDFGPDLASLKNRNSQSLLTEIINPANSIADKYDYWKIDLSGGRTIYGIIVHENAQAVTINQAGSIKTTLSKGDIRSKQKLVYSAMPNGLETGISPEEMASLLAFIRE